MPLFEVSAPNGSKYRVTVPDGAGEQDAIAYVADNIDKLPKYEPSITDKATDVAKEVGRGLGNVASDIGAGIRKAGQRLGVISDPDEDKYVAQNAKGPQDVERVRDEFRQRKYSGGGVMQDANNGGPGHFPVSEMNRPANTKPAEQLEAEAASDRRAAAREQALRDQPGLRRPLSKVNPLERDYATLQRIEAENKAAPLLAQTMEGRIARGINQGLDVPSAQGRAIMDATNGVENPVQQTGTDEELAASFEAAKEYGKAGFIRRAGAKALEGAKQSLYGAAEAYSDFLGTDNVTASLAKATARSNIRERAMGSRDGALGMLENAASSVIQNAPALVAGILTGGSALPFAMMYTQTFGSSYGDAKARGYSPTDAGIYASVNGLAEVVGERFGMKSFSKLLGKSMLGQPVAQIAAQAADHIIHEIPGEQLTTLIQFLADKGFAAGKTPNANLADYLAQAGETLVQTVLQSGMMYGGMFGIDKASRATGNLIAGDPGTGRRSLLERLAATGAPGEVGPVTGMPGGSAPPTGGGSQPLAAADVLGSAQAETAGAEASGTAGTEATPPGSPVPDTAPIMKTIAKAREAADAEELRQQKAVLDELQPDVDAIFKTTLKEGLAAGKAEETAQKEATAAAKLAEAEHKAAANDLEARIAQMEGDPKAIMAAATARPAIMATLDAAKAEAAALEKPAKKAGKAVAPAETIAEEPNAQPAPASQAPDALTVHDELADAVKAKLISKDDYAAASAELLGGNPAPAAQLLSGLTSNPDYVSRKISQAWKAGKITDQQQAEASAALAGGRVADALSIVRAGKPADVSKTNQEEVPADSGPVNRAESPAFGSLRTAAPARRSAGINALTSVIARGIDAPMDVIHALRQNGHMASARVATALAHLTGRKVVWYNSDDNRAGYTGEGGDRDTLYLNASSRYNILKVFGHELLHSLATSNPMLYASLVNRLKALMWNVPEYKAFILRTDPRTREWDHAQFDAHVTEEMIADFMGEFMVETGFWKNAFRGQDRGWVDRIRNAIIRAITDFQVKLSSVSQKGFNTGYMLAPAKEAIQQARDALEEAFNVFVNEAAAKNQSIDDLAHEAATSTKNELAPPTEAQIASGNYKKGHINVGGLDIAIENPQGSKRNPAWPTMKHHYGYIKGTVGKDKDHLDVFVNPGTEAGYNGPVFVIDQNNADGSLDEHKVMLGFPRERTARNAYLSNYTKGWESRIGGIRSFDSVDAFREWLKDANLQERAADTTVMSSEEDRPGKMSEEEMRAIQDELNDLNANIEHINYDNATVSEDEDFKSDGLNWTFHALGHRWTTGGYTIRLTNEGAYHLEGDGADLGDWPSLLSAAEFVGSMEGKGTSEQPSTDIVVEPTYRERVLGTAKVPPTKDEDYANELKFSGGGVKQRYRQYVREQIAEAWAELAATKGVKRYGKMSKAKTFEGIAKDFGMNPANTDRPRIVDIYKRIFTKGDEGNEWQMSPFDGDMEKVKARPFRDSESIRITLQMPGADGKKVYGDIIFRGNNDALGRPVAYLNTTQIGEGNLGRQFYQIVFNWAANNGVKIIQDPVMLTSINSFRRTELMLSAALRMGTTKMMGFPNTTNDQRLNGWIENPVKPLSSKNTHKMNYERDMENLANLILTSYDNVNHFIGDRLKAYSYDPKNDSIVRTNANGVRKTVSNEMLARAEAGRGDARLVGAGETTIRKFLITRWMLDELNRGADSSDLLDQMEAQGQGASQGVVYKMDDEDSGLTESDYDFHDSVFEAMLNVGGVYWGYHPHNDSYIKTLKGTKYIISEAQEGFDLNKGGGGQVFLGSFADEKAAANSAYKDAFGSADNIPDAYKKAPEPPDDDEEGIPHPDSFWEADGSGGWTYTKDGVQTGFTISQSAGISGPSYSLWEDGFHKGNFGNLDSAQEAGETYAENSTADKSQPIEKFNEADDNGKVVDLKNNHEIDLTKMGGTKQFYGGEKFSEDVVNGIKWEKFKKTVGGKKLTYWLEPGSGLVIVKDSGGVQVVTPSGDVASADGFIKAAKQLDDTYLIPGSTSKAGKKLAPAVLVGGFQLGGWTYQHMKQKQPGGMPNKQFLFHKPSGMKIEPQQIGEATYYSASIGNKMYATDEASVGMAVDVAKSVYLSTHTDPTLGSTGPVVDQDSVEQFLDQNPEYLNVVASTETAPPKKTAKLANMHDFNSLAPIVQEAVMFLAQHKGTSVTSILKAWGLQNPKGLYGEADLLGFQPSSGVLTLGDDASAEMKKVKQWLIAVTSTKEFKEWFGNSVLRYKSGYLKGLPVVYFRGDSANVKVFHSGGYGITKPGDVVIFASPSPGVAAGFGGKSAQGFDIKSLPDFSSNHIPIPKKNNLYPVFIRAEKPFDFENKEHLEMLRAKITEYNASKNIKTDISGLINAVSAGSWTTIEGVGVQKAIRSMGFDSFHTKEGAKNIAVYSKNQMKSATHNSGAWSRQSDDITMSVESDRPGMVMATANARPSRSLKERLYGTVSAVAAAPAPVTKAMQFTNKAANTILYPFKIIGDRTLAPVSDRLVQWGSNFMAAGARRQRIAHGLSSDYGLPEPYIDARNDREIEINKTLRKSKALIDRIASLDRAEARVAYLWMQEKPNSIEEQALMALLDPDSVAALTDMKQEIDRLGQEAVRLGLLSPESYARNKMAYLHRTYQKHELDNPDAVARATQAKAIRADAYKLRGLRDNVAAAGYPNAQKGDKFVRLEKRNAAGVLQNVAYVKQGQPAPAKYAGWTTDGVWEYRFDDRMKKHDEMGMWRDLTAQERGRLGEIDEVRYAFARTMIATVRDIETARFLDWVGSTYGKSGTDVLAMGGVIKDASDAKITMETYALNEWVQVPMTEIKGTGIKKYGGAAGYHIPGHIWNDIRTVMNLESNSEVWKLYDSLLKMWKISKTALSPAVHTNNVMSNFILADLAGLGVDDVRRALRVIFDAKAGNANAKALMERFYDSGSELGSMAQIELRQEVIEPLLKELQGQQNSTLAQLSLFQGISLAAHGKFSEAKAVLGSKAPVRALGVPFRAMIDLYRNEDAVFRLAKFIMETNAGKTDKDAGKLARAAFLDYNINAPWIQMIRRGPLPFVAFSYRAIPIIASAVVHQPHKVLKYAAVGHLLNAIAYALLGAGADEDQERRMMAKEKSGRALGVFPRMIRMPWNDEHNSPVFLDVRRWIPGGDIMDLMGSHSALPIPQWLSIGGPVSYFAEFFLNKSSFTGKPITLETDTASEKAVKVFDHLFKFLAPNLPVPNPVGWWADSAFDQIGLFQTYSWKSIQSAGSGETDAFGRERNLRQAILGSVGVKETSQPADAAEQRLKYEHDKQARELNEQKASLKRMLDRKGISPEKFETMMKNIERKQERISGEFQKAVSPEPASAQ